jgi:hypothetical protein
LTRADEALADMQNGMRENCLAEIAGHQMQLYLASYGVTRPLSD